MSIGFSLNNIMNQKEPGSCELAIVDSNNIPTWITERLERGTLTNVQHILDRPSEIRWHRLAFLAGTPSQNMQRVDLIVFHSSSPEAEDLDLPDALRNNLN